MRLAKERRRKAFAELAVPILMCRARAAGAMGSYLEGGPMFRLGVRNLRLLRDVPAFEIKPLTILVGRNSSGKSTYLRALPLLRQSITTRTSSPILWYGDSVDFGSFEGSVADNEDSSTITFTFGLDHVAMNQAFAVDPEVYAHVYRQFRFSDIILRITICKHRTGTRISEIEISESTNNAKYHVVINENHRVTSLKIDGAEILTLLKKDSLVLSEGSIFPTITMRPIRPEPPTSPDAVLRPAAYASLRDAISEIIIPRLDKRTTKNTLYRLESQLMFLGEITPDALRSAVGESTNRSWLKFISDITGPDRRGDWARIRRILLIIPFMQLMNGASQHLRELISSTLYIGPARARSERYYRYQDLSVSEIDPDGKNFPMFLNSLREPQLRNFSNWVRSVFGYGVGVTRESGHISIQLTSNRADVNVVDTGYGVSQILPVLGQVWWAANRPGSRFGGPVRPPTPQIIAIEQPELHLHPAHQALLANTLANSCKPAREGADGVATRLHFIVETHSETLINRLGELVVNGEVAPDDIQILVFEPEGGESRSAEVKVSRFNEKGYLENWPYGFFLPDVVDVNRP